MSNSEQALVYTGDQTNLSEPYFPSDELKEAVNIAIALERPLLLKGEPGCGKTRLAQAVAEEFGLKRDEHFFEWHVKSTSRAQDGLYIYDTIGRLRDSQLVATPYISDEERAQLKQKLADPEGYVNWGQLGHAFRNQHKRAVVLIDEIDKADLDFPNDLLNELDRKHFHVRETNPPIPVAAATGHEPIIFVTNNDEKPLPAAFLRRCLFHYIKFPEPDDLRRIVSHHVALDQEDDLVKKAVGRFWDLRGRMVKDKPHGGKKVNTSELIDWVRYMNGRPDRDKLAERLTDELLFPSILLKSVTDYARYADQPGIVHE